MIMAWKLVLKSTEVVHHRARKKNVTPNNMHLRSAAWIDVCICEGRGEGIRQGQGRSVAASLPRNFSEPSKNRTPGASPGGLPVHGRGGAAANHDIPEGAVVAAWKLPASRQSKGRAVCQARHTSTVLCAAAAVAAAAASAVAYVHRLGMWMTGCVLFTRHERLTGTGCPAATHILKLPWLHTTLRTRCILHMLMHVYIPSTHGQTLVP